MDHLALSWSCLVFASSVVIVDSVSDFARPQPHFDTIVLVPSLAFLQIMRKIDKCVRVILHLKALILHFMSFFDKVWLCGWSLCRCVFLFCSMLRSPASLTFSSPLSSVRASRRHPRGVHRGKVKHFGRHVCGCALFHFVRSTCDDTQLWRDFRWGA